MKTDEPFARQGVGELVAGLVQDVKDLIRQQVMLARDEIRGEGRKVKTAVISSAIAIGAAVVGGLLLVLMVVHGLNAVGVPLWVSYGIVGLALMITAAVLASRARKAAATFHLVPPATARTVKENVTWLKDRAVSRRG